MVLPARAWLNLLKPHAPAGDDGAVAGLGDPRDEDPTFQTPAGPGAVHAVRGVELPLRVVRDFTPHLASLADKDVQVAQGRPPNANRPTDGHGWDLRRHGEKPFATGHPARTRMTRLPAGLP